MEKMRKINMKKIEDCIVIILLSAILILSFLISFKTELNSHPDEKVHYDAVKYYQEHNLPLKFTSEEIIQSFSVHGESRLTELDAYYFLAGKYTSIINLISKNEVFNARSFNLILLAVILIICYKLYKNKSYLFMPFLLTSQVWYIFSYINNDAWAVFLNLIFVYQLFFKNSIFNKLINTTKEEIKNNPKPTIVRLILLGLLFYFLLIVKVNYLIATGISAIIYLIINAKKCLNKENILKIGSILLIGLIFVGIRLGIDFSINGLDRINNMEEIRLSRAAEAYKPPYTAEGFRWSQRGISIKEILKNKMFYEQTAFSFIGLYGYMNKPAPKILYDIVLISYIGFIIYIIVSNIRNRKKERIIPLVLIFIAGIITLGLSIYRSYTYDFQAQGRYLFPIIPLICASMYNQKKNKILELYFCIMTILLIVMYFLYGYCKF